jgi:hypothetical protein
MNQRSSELPVCTPLSSATIVAPGDAARIRSTISFSLSRSASVTRSPRRDFSS